MQIPRTLNEEITVFARLPPLSIVAIVCAALAAAVVLTYVFRRSPLVGNTKLWLLFGLGVFPAGVAFTGNVQGYTATKQRSFCGSCHVMTPYQHDSEDQNSKSLASRHARNKMFGDENCYMCHADYGPMGTVLTKIGGMGHVYYYYTEYRNMSLEEARTSIHIKRPFPNQTCMECHSTENALWLKTPDHKSSLQDVRDGRLSCASGGCHGYAHPWTKPPASASGSAASAPPPAPPAHEGGT